eukprot:TRINITY_DN4287_c0_g2_i1.p1 TRINITY_DN4287_c0_g2~~TRINITY_DN4287_c0_g2_i1.p1  ORF type:complete len:357 (+),score=63.18 TRINITY_DN4287_c0_g2_i1:124-1194(+)
MPPRQVIRSRTHDSDSESDADSPTHGAVNTMAHGGEEPRTLSQIKRSRIDLEKRYVFLCPSSLSKNFVVLPHQAKDSALLVFRCARNWVFQDASEQRRERLRSRIDCGLPMRKAGKKRTGDLIPSPRESLGALYRSEFSKEFLHWVLTKEKEGCVFWFKPERDLKKLSDFFQEKIDPVNEQPYKPLLLDPTWWRTRFSRTTAKHLLNPNPVIVSIADNSLVNNDEKRDRRDIDIPVLQELIYQSNPTLEPIAKWPHAPSLRFLPRASPQRNFVQAAPPGTVVFKGYIDQDLRSIHELGSTARYLSQDQCRIHDWPQRGRERLDDLYLTWANEDMMSARSESLARTGLFAMRPATSR